MSHRHPRTVPHGVLGRQRVRDRDVSLSDLAAEDLEAERVADWHNRLDTERAARMDFRPRAHRVVADESVPDGQKPGEIRRRFGIWTNK